MAKQYKKDELREMLQTKIERANKKIEALDDSLGYWIYLNHRDREKADGRKDAIIDKINYLETKIAKMKDCVDAIEEVEAIYDNVSFYSFSKTQPDGTEEQDLCDIYCEKVWVKEEPDGTEVYLEVL